MSFSNEIRLYKFGKLKNQSTTFGLVILNHSFDCTLDIFTTKSLQRAKTFCSIWDDWTLPTAQGMERVRYL